MKFSKYNNPSKKRRPRRMSREDADILATKNMLMDKKLGYDLPLSVYEAQSDRLCGKKSRTEARV